MISTRLKAPLLLTRKTSLFLSRRLLVVGLLVMTAFAIRLYHSDEPPLDFHATRQYRSLIIAHGYYAGTLAALPEWQRQVARINQDRQGILEPPLVESSVSLIYRVLGEQLWISKLLSSTFWLIGSGFLYLIAKRITDANAALVSMAIYLFSPFAITASRSFQPDPLMVLLLLASVYAILRYHDRPSTAGLMIAAGTSAAASFVKPVSLFAILAVFCALAIVRHGVRQHGMRQRIIRSEVVIFVTITLLPTLAFYLDGLFGSGFLRTQAQSSFLPQLLATPFFWKGWLTNIGLTAGWVAFIGALLGTLMARDTTSRALLLGLWTGYALFCLVFDYHIATHDYYHLQLIPIVALGIAPLAAPVIDRLEHIAVHWPMRLAVGSILAAALLLNTGIAAPRSLEPSLERKVAVAQEIGAQIQHNTNTVFLSSDYGLPLEYHGQLSGLPWPIASDLEWERLAGRSPLSARERFHQLFASRAPEYFIVLDLQDFEQQADLKEFLTQNYPLVVQTADYAIFDLRKIAHKPEALCCGSAEH